MIVYGVAANVSIARLFIAGVLPGLLLVALFSGYVVVWALLHPGADAARRSRAMAWAEKLRRLRLPAAGGAADRRRDRLDLCAAIATPTEAAALGVVGALLIAAVTGALGWDTFRDSLLGATRTSCMIGFILARRRS